MQQHRNRGDETRTQPANQVHLHKLINTQQRFSGQGRGKTVNTLGTKPTHAATLRHAHTVSLTRHTHYIYTVCTPHTPNSLYPTDRLTHIILSLHNPHTLFELSTHTRLLTHSHLKNEVTPPLQPLESNTTEPQSLTQHCNDINAHSSSRTEEGRGES